MYGYDIISYVQLYDPLRWNGALMSVYIQASGAVRVIMAQESIYCISPLYRSACAQSTALHQNKEAPLFISMRALHWRSWFIFLRMRHFLSREQRHRFSWTATAQWLYFKQPKMQKRRYLHRAVPYYLFNVDINNYYSRRKNFDITERCKEVTCSKCCSCEVYEASFPVIHLLLRAAARKWSLTVPHCGKKWSRLEPIICCF